MKILHHISLNADASQVNDLARLGFHVKMGFTSFSISEGDENSSVLKKWLDRIDHVDSVETVFTRKEVQGSPYCQAFATSHFGHPWPEDDYLQRVYDLSGYCSACGVGKRQKAPFALTAFPKGKTIFQTNWVFDEFFVQKDLWEEVFRPIGVNFIPVLLKKSGGESQEFVQLQIDARSDVELAGLDFAVCSTCARRKYVPVARGHFPALSGAGAPISKTSVEFGSDALAYSPVLFRADLLGSFSSQVLKLLSLAPSAPEALRINEPSDAG